VKNPIRNETSLVLIVAVIFSAIAIPALSGFLEPSQPPAVAAVQIGEPREDGGDAAGPTKPNPQPEPETADPRPPGDVQAERRRSSPRRADPTPPARSAPSAPADDAAEDDGGEAD
jgi:hypothetical protein